jgi:hypothetical protein
MTLTDIRLFSALSSTAASYSLQIISCPHWLALTDYMDKKTGVLPAKTKNKRKTKKTGVRLVIELGLFG